MGGVPDTAISLCTDGSVENRPRRLSRLELGPLLENGMEMLRMLFIHWRWYI